MGSRVKSVFFDVGNTLTYADLAVTLHPLTKRGIRPTDAQLRNAEIKARRALDASYASGAHPNPDSGYWTVLLTGLLESLGIQDENLLAEVAFEWRSARNWTRLAPGTSDVLERLSARYDLAVVSNADGTIARLLKQIGLARFFRSVTDSGVVGFQKPTPEIFHHALNSIGAAPEESVHVGDVYSIDYLGAQSVGMQAVLMDGSGTYPDLNVPKISQLDELEALLLKM